MEVREGIKLFDELLQVGYNRVDVLYHAALAHFKLSEYATAKHRLDMLLRLEPRHFTARAFQSVILDRASHDGLLGTTFRCSRARRVPSCSFGSCGNESFGVNDMRSS